MKEKLVFLVMLMCLLSFVLLFVSCDDENGDPDDTVTISGTAKVGEKITATSTGNGFETGSVFEWRYCDTADSTTVTAIDKNYPPTGTSISGNDDSVLTLGSGLVGKYIYADRRYNKDYNGTPWYAGSSRIGPVTN